jgi:putative FmdB family regulatory protein
MPIYEFKCLDCNELTELLFAGGEDKKEILCAHCGSGELERVLSASNFSMGRAASGPQTTCTTKSCGSGSCGAMEIPGLGD